MRGFVSKVRCKTVAAVLISAGMLLFTVIVVCLCTCLSVYADNESDIYFDGNAAEVQVQYYSNLNADDLMIAAVVVIAVSLLIAFFATAHKISQMDTAKGQNFAENYKVDGSTDIYRRDDIYLYSTVRKVPRPKDNNNSRGGPRQR